MHPVLGEIRDQQQRQHLRRERQPRHRAADPLNPRPVEQDGGRPERQDREDLDEQRVDEEIGEVDRPLTPEDRLLGAQREQPFERHEHGRVEHQVQHEEIDAEPRAGRVAGRSSRPRAAQQGRGQREADAGERQHLVRAQPGADRAEQERRDQRHVDRGLQIGERSHRPELGIAEGLGEPQGEHDPEAGDAQHRRGDAADEPGAERGRFRRFQRKPLERRRLSSRVSHGRTPFRREADRTGLRSAGRRVAGSRRSPR